MPEVSALSLLTAFADIVSDNSKRIRDIFPKLDGEKGILVGCLKIVPPLPVELEMPPKKTSAGSAAAPGRCPPKLLLDGALQLGRSRRAAGRPSAAAS